MKPEEKLMTLAGALLLVSLPFLSGIGFYIWLVAKGVYGVGVFTMWVKK